MPTRVLVVAFDAFDIDLSVPWTTRGLLPNLAGVLGDAMRVETRSAPGLFAGEVWPSFLTGVSPARHRRYYLRQTRHGQYVDVPVDPSDLAAEPFWESLSRAGRRVAVIDVPHARPSRGINGIHIVDWTTHDPAFQPALSEPAEVLPDLDRRFGRQTADRCDDIARTAGGITSFLRSLESKIATKAEAAGAMLGRENWDFFLTTFTESHCVGHQLFHQHKQDHPMHDPALAAVLGDPVLKIYQKLDGALGQLCAAAGPNAIVCVVLSHGMGPAYTDENVVIDDVLRRIEQAQGTAPRSPYARLRRQWYRIPARVRDAWPLGALRGRVLPSLHQSLLFPERETRRFFAVPNNAVAGAIRINVRGRDASGQVDAAEYDTVCEELRRELLGFVDTGSGEPWIRDVVRINGRYSGPFADELPDLVAEWNRARPILAVTSPRLGTFRPPLVTRRTGDHTNHGAFLVRGPGVRRGRRAQAAEVLDIPPTLARLVGVPLEGSDGSPINECIP